MRPRIARASSSESVRSETEGHAEPTDFLPAGSAAR